MSRASAYQLSRLGYYADFITVPFATSIAAVWLFTLHAVDPVSFALAFLAGIAAWSFAEYAIHRWVFHGHSYFRKQHAIHHVRPHDFIGTSSASTGVAGAIAFFALTLAFGAVIGVGLLVGFVAGYLSYIVVHDRFHHADGNGTWMATLNRNHDFHHKHFRANFGVTSPVWDFIFGTYKHVPR